MDEIKPFVYYGDLDSKGRILLSNPDVASAYDLHKALMHSGLSEEDARAEELGLLRMNNKITYASSLKGKNKDTRILHNSHN